ncbi:paraquat-inducible protein A [Pseudomonas sp. NW5]|uniref:paraquat-inducible protein A n=1 Tax=Pseudomonas sp. NW5 TaxID=2934934 RepID=UPI002021CF4E|nr:paraquat-inducible protein A [Pseudomonas sp. NW5]MCL7462752.1 paraquat-inducible protein A [Pseudomonas sp. NW5]
MPTTPPHHPLQDLPLEQLLACHDCDLLLRRPVLGVEQKARCPRCGCELFAQRAQVQRRSLALVLTALLLFIPANFLPIMQLELLGQRREETVWSGVLGLYYGEMQVVALVVFLCSMVIPLLKLLCQLAVLLCIQWRMARGWGRGLYRAYHHLREWGMLEVYLIGILVSIVKLVDMADLRVGVGLFCFIALLLAQIWLEVSMSPQQIWAALEDEHARP